jgi:hypothetical protein
METAFSYKSIALQPIRVMKTHIIGEVTVFNLKFIALYYFHKNLPLWLQCFNAKET